MTYCTRIIFPYINRICVFCGGETLSNPRVYPGSVQQIYKRKMKTYCDILKYFVDP